MSATACGKLHDGDPCTLPAGHDPRGIGQACCPSSECWACSGEACWLCGAGLHSVDEVCDHDVLDRHREMR